MSDYTLPPLPLPASAAFAPQVQAYGHACRAPLLARIAELEAELTQVSGYCETLTQRCVDDTAENARLRAEVEALRGFAQKVMEAWPECGLDGFELEDYAKEFGLIQSTRVEGPCGEDCACLDACADWPTDCYHRTPLLTGSGPWVNPLAADAERYRTTRELLGAGIDSVVNAAIAARKGEGSEG